MLNENFTPYKMYDMFRMDAKFRRSDEEETIGMLIGNKRSHDNRGGQSS